MFAERYWSGVELRACWSGWDRWDRPGDGPLIAGRKQDVYTRTSRLIIPVGNSRTPFSYESKCERRGHVGDLAAFSTRCLPSSRELSSSAFECCCHPCDSRHSGGEEKVAPPQTLPDPPTTRRRGAASGCSPPFQRFQLAPAPVHSLMPSSISHDLNARRGSCHRQLAGTTSASQRARWELGRRGITDDLQEVGSGTRRKGS